MTVGLGEGGTGRAWVQIFNCPGTPHSAFLPRVSKSPGHPVYLSRSSVSGPRSCPQGPHLFRGLVGGAHQGSAFHPFETQLEAEYFQLFKFLRGIKAIYRQVVPAGLEVLPDGEDIHLPAADVGHGLFDLIQGISQADHQAGFGEDTRREFLGVDQGGPGGFIGALGLDGS